jgi:hypothetical protein
MATLTAPCDTVALTREGKIDLGVVGIERVGVVGLIRVHTVRGDAIKS